MPEEVLEHATHAPEGERCLRCGYEIYPGQLASRVAVLPGAAGYKHLQFAQCRKAAGRRLVELKGPSK